LSIEISGVIDEKDYIRAQYLNLKPRPTMMVVGVLVLVLLSFALVMATRELLSGQVTSAELLLFGAVLFVAGYFQYLHRGFKRNYRQYKSLHEPFSMELTERELQASSSLGEAKIPWENFVKFKENKHLFLLYPCDNLFHMIPKRLVPDTETQSKIRSLLKEKLGQHR